MRTTDFNIAVLAGGFSSEREISLASGKAVFEALQSSGHRVTLLDLREAFLDDLRDRRVDFVFIAMHGKFGEDGTLQEILDREGYLYSGSGPEACRRAMDKVEARARFQGVGLSVAPARVVLTRVEGLAARLTFPLFLKPACGGSSIGVSLVESAGELEEGFSRAFREDERVLMEELIRGREFTVGILGNRVFSPIEVITRRKFFDYEAKYVDSSTCYDTDPALSAGELEQLQATARAAHEVLGLEVFSRTDLIQSPQGVFVMEVNAIPGLTPKSLLPKMAWRDKMSFPDLCRLIIEESLVKKEVSLR